MKRIFSLLTFILLPLPFFAKDFGVEGHCFPILEKSLSEELIREANHLNKERLKEELIERSRSPGPGRALQKAKVNRSFFHDPTYTLDRDIKDAANKTLFRKGRKINPLKGRKLRTVLLFLNGADPEQLSWAASQEPLCKWVLVEGNPIELERDINRPVYFDQRGTLISKLNIQALPAKVTQKGEVLLIEEVRVKREKLCNRFTNPPYIGEAEVVREGLFQKLGNNEGYKEGIV